jgi:uncharacterized membrane protein YjdF
MKNIKYAINFSKGVIIAYSVFLGLFSLDTAFGIGWFMHLLPAIIPLGILIFTWKKPKLAGILFTLFGVATILFFNTYLNLTSFLTISLIPLAVGILHYYYAK